MQTIGTLHRDVPRRRSRLVGAGVAAVLGCLFLIVLLLGLSAERPQSAASAVASADAKDLQAQFDRTAQEVAILRGTVDQMRTDLAALRGQREAEQASATTRAPQRARDLQAALPGGNPDTALRLQSDERPTHPVASTHRYRRAERLPTVVVDGVTYVEGREPHALSLPVQ